MFLRDYNILSLVQKVSPYSPGMYILLFNPSQENIDFFASFNVHVIEATTESKGKTEATLEILADIWEQTLNLQKRRPVTYETSLNEVMEYYNKSEFQKAYDLITQIETTWRGKTIFSDIFFLILHHQTLYLQYASMN